MKKIKIGLFVDTFYPHIDGVVVVVDNYARKLSKVANVTVVCPSYGLFKNKNYNYPYKIFRINSVKVPIVNYNLAMPKINPTIKLKLMREKFDIIHIHSPFSIGKLGMEIAEHEKNPVVATLHSQFKQDFKRYFKSDRIANALTKKVLDLYNKCDECYTVNKSMCKIFKEYGYKKNPVVIPNVTDMKPVSDKYVSCENINHKYDLTDKDTVLLFVGRINLLKNILFIADTLKCLKDMKFKFKMIFVGSGKDLSILQEKIDEYNLNDSVIFAGEIKNREILKSIYSRSDLFIFPSLYDTNSLVQIEAASQKTPTIFLEGAVTASTIKNEINGFYGPNDPQKYAKKIIDILKNKNLYDKVSNKAFKDIYKTYDKVVTILYKRYIKLINNKKSK